MSHTETLCAAIALSLGLLTRLVDAILSQVRELLDSRGVDMTKR